MTAIDTPVRLLSLDDLHDCLLLAIDRQWLPEEGKWRLLFEVGEVYGIDDPAGGLAGTMVLTRYERDLAVIGMVLVAERHGRKGLGQRLMLHAIERSAGATIFLTATKYGRPVYERVGFEEVGTVITHKGHLTLKPEDLQYAGVRPAREADLEALIRLDAEAFGVVRTQLITRLFEVAERLRVVERDGVITGFGAVWRNLDEMAVGPVVAESMDVATALLADLAAGLRGPVRFDADIQQSEFTAWAAARGMPEVFSTALMVHGGRIPGTRARLFTSMMLALG